MTAAPNLTNGSFRLAFAATKGGKSAPDSVPVTLINLPPKIELSGDKDVTLDAGKTANFEVKISDEAPDFLFILATNQNKDLHVKWLPEKTNLNDLTGRLTIKTDDQAGESTNLVSLYVSDGVNPLTNGRVTIRIRPKPPTNTVPPVPPTTTNELTIKLPGLPNSMVLEWVPGLPGGGPFPGKSEAGGWVGKYPVSEAEFAVLMPTAKNPGASPGTPANCDWKNATNFCQRLSQAASVNANDWKFNLPSMRQWEFYAISNLDGLQRAFATSPSRTRKSVTLHSAEVQTVDGLHLQQDGLPPLEKLIKIQFHGSIVSIQIQHATQK
jgi:hypothetical protein